MSQLKDHQYVGEVILNRHPSIHPDHIPRVYRTLTRQEFPHIDLMIDPVCAYTVPEALAVGKVLDDLNFYHPSFRGNDLTGAQTPLISPHTALPQPK